MLRDGELPLGDGAGENHHDGEAPEVVLLLSIRERYVFFLLGANEEKTRLQRGQRASEFGRIFCHIPGEYGEFIKRRLAP